MAIYNQILAAMKPITTAAPTTTAATYDGLVLIPAEANLANVVSGGVSVTATNVTRNTTTVKYGTGSAFFTGTTCDLKTASPISHGTGNFTLEAWIYPTARSNGSSPYSLLFSDVAGQGQQLYTDSTGKLGAYFGTIGANVTTTVISLNTWTHVAFVRNGSGTNNCTLYINGVNSKQFTYTASFNTDLIGRFGGTGYNFAGYMDNIGISNTARYTGNFTPGNIY